MKEGEEKTANVDITFPIDFKEDLLLVDEKLQSEDSRKKVVSIFKSTMLQ